MHIKYAYVVLIFFLATCVSRESNKQSESTTDKDVPQSMSYSSFITLFPENKLPFTLNKSNILDEIDINSLKAAEVSSYINFYVDTANKDEVYPLYRLAFRGTRLMADTDVLVFLKKSLATAGTVWEYFAVTYHKEKPIHYLLIAYQVPIKTETEVVNEWQTCEITSEADISISNYRGREDYRILPMGRLALSISSLKSMCAQAQKNKDEQAYYMDYVENVLSYFPDGSDSLKHKHLQRDMLLLRAEQSLLNGDSESAISDMNNAIAIDDNCATCYAYRALGKHLLPTTGACSDAEKALKKIYGANDASRSKAEFEIVEIYKTVCKD